jgi:amino acid transporter
MTETPPAAETRPPRLERALGRWDLTAIGVNQVIGGAIFLMPSQVAAAIGAWSVIAFVAAGVASLLVAWCFAELSSRFEATGGAFLYTRVAFGPFLAFEVGWMQWFTRITSHASIANGVALALGFFAPALAGGVGRVAIITAIMVAFAWINARGIRQSSWLVNTLTIGKLAPLALFVLVGLPYLSPAILTPLPDVTFQQASTTALLLVFVFGGFDVVSVPAGESQDPRRHMPFAFTATIVIVTVVMTLGQAVAMAALPELAASRTPLADAAVVVLGAAGAMVVGVGSAISMLGNNAGQVLTGSRMLFAVAENGDLPRIFARVHPRYHTPDVAIWFSTAVALVLALSGSFVALAAASAVARLVTYVGTCAATLRLRQPRFADRVAPATWTTPGGPLVPLLAILVSLVILMGVTRQQFLSGVAALAGGALLYALAPRRRTSP